jgi:hypothetical protein
MKGLELAREIAPRDGETGTMDVLMEAMRTFGKPLAEAAIMAKASGMQMPDNPAALPAPPQQIHAAQPNPIQHPQEDEMTLMLRYYAAQLADQAANDRDPYVYANLLVDNAPEEKLQEFMNTPNLKEYIFSLNQELTKYPDWVDEFIKTVRELLTAEEESGSVPENAPNTDNPGKPADA